MNRPKSINLIVAHDDNWLIGNSKEKTGLPWHCPEDMAWFKEKTMGQPLIMGENTWQTLNCKPLNGRTNIILSRKRGIGTAWINKQKPFVSFCQTVEHALHIASKKSRDVFIIGGAQIYNHFLANNLVDIIYSTHVKGVFEGDTYLPCKLGEDWTSTGRILIDSDSYSISKFMKPKPVSWRNTNAKTK